MEALTMFTTIAVALITAVIGPIAVTWARTKFENKPKKSPLDEAIQANTLVDEQIDQLIKELEADRVWVAQFHNGGTFYPTGKSIQKFSIFYEKCMPDAVSIMHTFQNVPCSLFPKALSTLYKEGELAIPTFKKGEDYDLTSIARPYNTQSFYMLSLEDLHGRFIGAMAIAYNTEHKFTKEDWILVRQKAGVIGTLLDEYLNTPK
jgi:hypothetical protein